MRIDVLTCQSIDYGDSVEVLGLLSIETLQEHLIPWPYSTAALKHPKHYNDYEKHTAYNSRKNPVPVHESHRWFDFLNLFTDQAFTQFFLYYQP